MSRHKKKKNQILQPSKDATVRIIVHCGERGGGGDFVLFFSTSNSFNPTTRWKYLCNRIAFWTRSWAIVTNAWSHFKQLASTERCRQGFYGESRGKGMNKCAFLACLAMSYPISFQFKRDCSSLPHSSVVTLRQETDPYRDTAQVVFSVSYALLDKILQISNCDPSPAMLGKSVI